MSRYQPALSPIWYRDFRCFQTCQAVNVVRFHREAALTLQTFTQETRRYCDLIRRGVVGSGTCCPIHRLRRRFALV